MEVEQELEQLYERALEQGEAVIKACRFKGNYGCCGNHAPMIDKYKITKDDQQLAFYLWGTLQSSVDLKTQAVFVKEDPALSNYEQKVIAWFISQAKK